MGIGALLPVARRGQAACYLATGIWLDPPHAVYLLDAAAEVGLAVATAAGDLVGAIGESRNASNGRAERVGAV